MREKGNMTAQSQMQPDHVSDDTATEKPCDLERYAALGRACEAHGQAGYGEDGEMWFEPPAGAVEDATMERIFSNPVAWRVKDFADGWILCHSLSQACREAEGAGNRIEPLFAPLSSEAALPTPPVDGEDGRAATSRVGEPG